jgi:hypothetical protein
MESNDKLQGTKGSKQNDRINPSDLSDEEWAILAPLISTAKPEGHPRTTDMRAVCNALD